MLQLHQDSIAVLGMEEHDWLPVSSYPRFRAKTTDVLGLNIRYSSLDVVDLDTDVVNAPSLVLLQESSYGRLLSKRMQQFQLCV